MVKVGTVYKTNGNVNINDLSLRVKISIFFHNLIDNSFILTGNKSKLLKLKEEEESIKINNYIKAIDYYLTRSVYKHQLIFSLSYDINDDELVRIALGHPCFFEYTKEFIQLEHDLVELKAFNSGVVILRRVEQS